MKTLLLLLLAVPAFALAHEDTPFGRAGDPNAVSRAIEVDMSDRMRFAPSEITVKRGQTVRFNVKNSGKVQHEFVLGTMASLKEHAEMMRKHPGMEHDDPHSAHAAPGKGGTVVWQFTRPGEFYFACLVPGHFEAGMVGKVKVTDARSAYPGRKDSLLLSLALAALPAAHADDRHHPPQNEGEIRKVDKDAGKITIKHGPLAKLEMPAMTMVFRVQDPGMLDKVKAGDKVKFDAEKIGGAFTVTRIETAQ